MNRVLRLAVLSQALLDLIDKDDETALIYLAAYPQLLQRLSVMSRHQKIMYYQGLERAMGRQPERKFH